MKVGLIDVHGHPKKKMFGNARCFLILVRVMRITHSFVVAIRTTIAFRTTAKQSIF